MTGHKFTGLFAETGNTGNQLVKILWSGFYFALAFILINYLNHLTTALLAAQLDYQTLFSYDGIKPITNNPDSWTLKRVAFVYLSYPLLCFIVSIALIVFLHTTQTRSHLALFLFWLSVNAFALFYSYFFTGIIGAGKYTSVFYTGFALFFSWLYLGPGQVTIVLMLLLILFSFFAFIFTGLALKFSYSNQLLKTVQGRNVFFINTILLPFITAILLIGIASYPLDREYQIIRIISLFAMFLMLFIKLQTHKPLSGRYIQKGGIEYKSPLVLLALVVVLTLIVRAVLSKVIAF